MELLSTHTIIFPLGYKSILLSIRNGDLTIDEILSMSKQIEEIIESRYKTTNLPTKPNFKEINSFVIRSHIERIENEKNTYCIHNR